MPDYLGPDSLAANLADMDRRLRMLEISARGGADRNRWAWGTAAADPTVFGANETGPVGSTWQDDKGNTGTGYPSLTITNMPSRARIEWAARPTNIAAGATYRCNQVTIGILVNGAVLGVPRTERQITQTNAAPADVAQYGFAIRTFTPGTTYTFQLYANWFDNIPAAANLPRLTDIQLVVIPYTSA